VARVTYVKHARQRYATRPVIDPATGEQKKTPMMKNGVQMKDKRGNPTFLRVTEHDTDRPLPNEKCEACGKEIEPGMAYKHVTPRSGPFGGFRRVRCADCPTWQPWDLSQALWARLAQISHDFWEEFGDAGTVEDVQSVIESGAEMARELASEKQEAADNLESGFGHETEQSTELADIADQLESWADEIESVDLPDHPEDGDSDPCEGCDGEGDVECDECSGSGKIGCEACGGDGEVDEAECDECDGEGEVRCDECGETGRRQCDCGGTGEGEEFDFDAWKEEVESALSIVDEPPVG